MIGVLNRSMNGLWVSRRESGTERPMGEPNEGGSMKRKFIPVAESFERWKKEPGYAATYASLEEEFALASTLIKTLPTHPS